MKELFDRLLEAGQHPPQHLLDEIAALDQAVVPRLIDMATDRDLIWADSDSPAVWAPTHAMRLLGRLQAAQAIDPLLTLLRDEEAEWVYEELPTVLAQIGPAIVGPLKAFTSDRTQDTFEREATARSLIQLIQTHPQVRDDLISFFRSFLSPYPDETPEDEIFRGHLIADLLDIRADELYPDIEAAYLGDRVDETIVGLDTVQQEWGIRDGATPRKRADFELWLKCAVCGFTRSHALEYVYYDEGTAERKSRGEQVPYDPVVIPREIVCPKCGAVDRYELAPDTYFQITGELLKMAAQTWNARVSGKAQGPERLRLIHFTMKGGRSAHPFEAIDHYREQIEHHPQRAEPHLRLGNVLRILGRWNAATTEYERALELNAYDASPLAAQAEMEVLRGNAERAIELFETYLQRTPARPPNREDAELWDGAHESLEQLKSGQGSLLEKVARSKWSSTQDVSALTPVRSEALSRRTDEMSGSRASSKSQTRKKKRAKRKSARKARKRKK
jgi:tetratricopeptide (TPR) repeat protein